MTSLLTKGATTTTTVINQAATPVPIGTIPAPPMTTLVQRTAGQVLRQGNYGTPSGFVRAQSVFFNPATGELVVE